MHPIRGDAKAPTSFSEVEHQLGICEFPVPATGNCQVFAVAQALLETQFHQEPEQVCRLAASLKKGVQQVAELNWQMDFTWEARRSIVKRAYPRTKITKANSSKLLLQWFHQFADSPTDGITQLPKSLWGDNDTLRMMSKFLKKDIFILGQEGDGKWACIRHEFRTVSSKGGNYQTSKERL
ncbi:hypothetical protein V7S43_009604 [Phytophthora oleae]|uniref:OTU domain-containing protein n=1 Tax=Phytophthora oleae TaxID=2107226 RepID=A0ABD3FI79_9STRA